MNNWNIETFLRNLDNKWDSVKDELKIRYFMWFFSGIFLGITLGSIGSLIFASIVLFFMTVFFLTSIIKTDD